MKLKILCIDIETLHMTVYVILQLQNWRDDTHQALAHNYSEDWKILR
jgi:hypothetical protein